MRSEGLIQNSKFKYGELLFSDLAKTTYVARKSLIRTQLSCIFYHIYLKEVTLLSVKVKLLNNGGKDLSQQDIKSSKQKKL